MVFDTLKRCIALSLVMGLAITAWILVFERSVEAYVDPGSGSMLMQLVLGGIFGALVMLRSGWQRIREWFGRRPDAPHGTDARW
jgi:hypothetical protein